MKSKLASENVRDRGCGDLSAQTSYNAISGPQPTHLTNRRNDRVAIGWANASAFVSANLAEQRATKPTASYDAAVSSGSDGLLSFARVSHPLTIPSFFGVIERRRLTIAPTSRQDVQQTNPNNQIAVPSRSRLFFGENPFVDCAGTLAPCHKEE
jgi:hypothetical protein